uniref:Fatty acyl-CoA reductase n=1 Tax=Aegilops tauschii TaxID=37682 RepID=N1R0K9_AEGTA
MDATAVVGCFRDRTILVTGSTGFLGKCMQIPHILVYIYPYTFYNYNIYIYTVLVEKILRVQPNVKKLYLVVRASDAASAEQRILSQVLGKDLFNTMREKHGLAGFEELIQEKIVPLAGDIGIQNFGLDRSTVDDLCEEIDVIIHGAATTSFYERYDVALASNALGAKYICEFAKKCSNMKLLLHLSTAFVAGTRKGLLLEEALQMGETLRPGYCLDIKAELRLVEKIKTELRVANSGGPDQSLEKTAMKELGLKRTIDALIVAYTEQAFPCFVGDRKNIMDAVPADMVVNATLVAMAVHWNEKGYVIYHVCSALQNPLSGYVLEDACWDYFSKHPRIREDGKPLKNKRPYVFKRFTLFRAYLIMVYKLPLEILHAVSLLFCGLFSQSYNKYNRRYNFLILLVKLYAPYAFFKGW